MKLIENWFDAVPYLGISVMGMGAYVSAHFKDPLMGLIIAAIGILINLIWLIKGFLPYDGKKR